MERAKLIPLSLLLAQWVIGCVALLLSLEIGGGGLRTLLALNACLGGITVLALLKGSTPTPDAGLADHTQQVLARIDLLDSRGRDRTDRTVAAVEEERAKESRHEYWMERSLQRLEKSCEALMYGAGRVLQLPHGTRPARRRVLFVTSNGAGLGHITRCLAIVDALPEEVEYEILTLSTGYRVVRENGYRVRYFPSAGAAGVPPSVWEPVFADHLRGVVAEIQPSVMVFDGTWLYPPVTHVARSGRMHLIWLQRGCWKPEADRRSGQRRSAGDHCDEVVIPGDYACQEDGEPGSEVRVTKSSPVVLRSSNVSTSRIEACTALGLDPRQSYVLVNLGGGILHDGSDLSAAASAVASLGEEWRTVVCRSPLEADRGSEGGDEAANSTVVEIRAYPVSNYFAAFEFAIVAGGYNSVQESLAFQLPIIVVPNPRTLTDDQVARARGVEAGGWGIHLAEGGDFREAIRRMVEQLPRCREALQQLPRAEGAREIADLIAARTMSGHWSSGTEWVDALDNEKGGGTNDEEPYYGAQ